MILQHPSNYFKLLFLLLLVSFACKKTPEEEVDQEALCLPDPQYVSFQSQIDDATDGDVIIVEPGTYEGLVDFKGKNITVASQYITDGDTSFISKTIIDAKGLGSAVRFANGETSDARLSGFTITGGLAPKGGGIYAKEASPTLDHLKITNNKTFDCSTDDNFYKGSGGGLYFEQSMAKLSHVMILDNTSTDAGGGIYLDNSEIEFVEMGGGYANSSPTNGGGIYSYLSKIKSFHSLISGNKAEKGGGIFITTFSKFDFLNSIIGSNVASSEGGGLYMVNSDLEGTNISIMGNTAPTGGGAYMDGSEWDFMNGNVYGNEPDAATFKETDGSSISLQYSGIRAGGGNANDDTDGIITNGDVDLSQGNLHLLEMSIDYAPVSMDDLSTNFIVYSYCDRIPGWGTFLGEYIFWKNHSIDKGNPDSQYNDADWRYCVDGTIPRKVNPTSLDETPDSNYVRNDMGAYGGPGGNWLPIGYKDEVEE